MTEKLNEIKKACLSRISEIYSDETDKDTATNRLIEELNILSKSDNNINALYLFWKICEKGLLSGNTFFLRGSISSLITVSLLNRTFFYIDPLFWKTPIISALGKKRDKKLALELNCSKGYFEEVLDVLQSLYPGKSIVPLSGSSMKEDNGKTVCTHHGFAVFDSNINLENEEWLVVDGRSMLQSCSSVVLEKAIIRVLTTEHDELSNLADLLRDSAYKALTDIEVSEFFDYSDQMVLYSDVYKKNTKDFMRLRYAAPQNIVEYADFLAASHASLSCDISFEEYFDNNSLFTREAFGEAIMASGFDEEYSYSCGIDIGITPQRMRDDLLIRLDVEGVPECIVEEASKVLYLMPRSHVLSYSFLHYGLAFLNYESVLRERGKACFSGTS